MNKLNKIYDFLIEWNIATESEIQLVTKINGWNEDSFNDIIYVKTGYRDMKQLKESEWVMNKNKSDLQLKIERRIDEIRDVAIRSVDRMVDEGIIKDCTDTNDTTEFDVQDIIFDEIKNMNLLKLELF